jgi:hypothetical protein
MQHANASCSTGVDRTGMVSVRTQSGGLVKQATHWKGRNLESEQQQQASTRLSIVGALDDETPT